MVVVGRGEWAVWWGVIGWCWGGKGKVVGVGVLEFGLETCTELVVERDRKTVGRARVFRQ